MTPNPALTVRAIRSTLSSLATIPSRTDAVSAPHYGSLAAALKVARERLVRVNDYCSPKQVVFLTRLSVAERTTLPRRWELQVRASGEVLLQVTERDYNDPRRDAIRTYRVERDRAYGEDYWFARDLNAPVNKVAAERETDDEVCDTCGALTADDCSCDDDLDGLLDDTAQAEEVQS